MKGFKWGVSLFVIAASTSLYSQDERPMVYDEEFLKENQSINDGRILIPDLTSEEILVVVEDILGNDIYSKVVFTNSFSILQAKDPYNIIPPGVYTIVACARKELFNQKVVVD